jgi:hypothetical protein
MDSTLYQNYINPKPGFRKIIKKSLFATFWTGTAFLPFKPKGQIINKLQKKFELIILLRFFIKLTNIY